MNLGIKTKQIDSDTFLAQVDWELGDAGQVGTPGAIKYGLTANDAYEKLKILLESKGHNIINSLNQ